jgi:hypothetical protein
MIRFVVALAFALGMGVLALAITRPVPERYITLAERGRFTPVVVTALEANNHQQVRYSFRVQDRIYTGLDGTGAGTPPFERLSLGDTLPGAYLPEDPSVSGLGDVATRATHEAGQREGIAFFGSLIVFVMVFRNFGRRTIWGERIPE